MSGHVTQSTPFHSIPYECACNHLYQRVQLNARMPRAHKTHLRETMIIGACKMGPEFVVEQPPQSMLPVVPLSICVCSTS